MNPELVKQHPFLDERAGGKYAFYCVPKTMLTYGKTIGISTDETMLYTILRDRLSLSMANGKVDDMGRIYVFYSREKAAARLGWSLRKTVDVFKALTEHGLLYEECELSKTGRTLGKRLYVKLWQEVTFDFTLADIQAGNYKFATAQTLQETNMGAYYSLPVVLVEDERYCGLPLRSILLYMVILERLSAAKRYGQVDENGLLWTTLDIPLVGKELGCSERSLSRAFKELEELGLVVRKAVSYAERWRIYARDFAPPPLDADSVPSPTPKEPVEDKYFNCDANSAPLARQICTPDSPDLHTCDANSAPLARQNCTLKSPNLHPNHPPFTQPLFTHPSQEANLSAAASQRLEAGRPAQRENLKALEKAYETLHYDDVLTLIYTRLKENSVEQAIELLDECSSIVQRDIISKSSVVVFGRNSVPRREVLTNYDNLSCHTVYLLIEKTIPLLDSIKNLKAYLHQGLFTAAKKHGPEAYYLQKETEH